MGSTHKSSRTSRRINKLTVGETKRELATTDRREILRVGHNRVYVCGFERVLLPPDERSECTLKKLVLETNTRSCVGSGQHKFVLYWVRQTQVCVSKLVFGISTQTCVNYIVLNGLTV